MAVNQFPFGFVGRLWGLFFGLIFFAVTLPALLLLCLIPGQGGRRVVVRQAARLVLGLSGTLPKVHGLEKLPAGPCVVVANHASYLDGMILTAALPARFAFVIKREMTQVPLAHFMLRRIGSEFLERESSQQGKSDARRILQQAGSGQSLVFFPEGTFQLEPGLQRFRAGAFKAAQRGSLPLVPIVICGSRRMLPANRRLPGPARLEVQVGEPLPTDAEMATQALIQQCRSAMLPLLCEPDLAPGDQVAWRSTE